MSVDPNILPAGTPWNGITPCSRSINNLLNDYSDIWLYTDDNNVLRRYLAPYCTYGGGNQLLSSSYSINHWDPNNRSYELTKQDSKPVNISLQLQISNTSNTPWSNAYLSSTAGSSTYYQISGAPVVAFDPNKICMLINCIIANTEPTSWGTLDTSTVELTNVINDSVYDGIMQNGKSNNGNYALIGWYPTFYVGSETERSLTSRISVIAESVTAAYTGDETPQATYTTYNGGVLNTRHCQLYDSSSNPPSSGTLASPLTSMSRNVGMTAIRKLYVDSGLDFIQDGNTGFLPGEDLTIKISNYARGTVTFHENAKVIVSHGTRSSIGYIYAYAYMSGNDVVKSAAAMGLWFTDVASRASGGTIGSNCTDDNIHIGVIDDNGYTDGSYVSGAEAARSKQASWTNAIADAEAAGYVPLDPSGQLPYVDPSHYDDDNATVFPLEGYVGNTAKLYPLQYGQVTTLLTYLNNTAANLESDNEALQKFLTNNPIDIISGILYYPVDIFDIATDVPAAADNIILGNVETDVEARRLRSSTAVYNAGKCIYYPPDGLNDFRSYSPYSSAELYIPYCGSVKIDPADYIGHEISVKYLIDLATGACIALVLRDKLVLDSIAGQIGVQLPISGAQTASLQAAQHQATMQAQSAKVAAAAAIVGVGAAFFTAGSSLALTAAAVGGATALYGAAQKIEGTEYQLEHQEIPYKGVGTSTSTCSMQNEQACRLVIRRPVMLDDYSPRIYGKTKGFSCLLNVKLSEVKGYTQVSNADLSGIDATESEKELLLSIMQSGFYM